ncbi:hypothetical protein B0H63DRAFT_514109 [Podospora didyma]|uniref:Uncharacterized protein n=1 Tax=Podospora didyma TaxID=330526 RepID=A0AAE0K4K5_9PEZI|nr:hypothetical protein B0H63DRAFT_514109 [Podospora didyma]
MNLELADEDRTARIIWAGHILSYLTRHQSNIRLRGLQLVQAAHEDEEEEKLPDDDQLDSDAATERMACLSWSQESIRFRFLDCAAQLLSPSKGWECALSADIRQFLHTKPQAKDGRKIWHVLKSLARPILDCRTLRDIAIRHPQFQNIHICPVRQRHKTSLRDAYRDEHEVDITFAWNKLAPGGSSLPEAEVLVDFSNKFKSDCGKSFALHAEMQLFMHCESGAAFKKACLLCKSFLEALARPVATRGRRICYPAWGVPPPTSPGTVTALEELGKMLVSRVKSHLADSVRIGKRLVVPAVHQSTILEKRPLKPTLNSSKRQGYKAKSLHLDPELPDAQQYASCNARRLTGAATSFYVRNLRAGLQGLHHLTRGPYSSQQMADEDKPQMIWVFCERKQDPDDGVEYDTAQLHPLLGSDNPFIATCHVNHNPIRGRQLGSSIALWAPKKAGYAVALRFRETFLIDGSSSNRSILASAGIYDAVPHQWRGSVVAMRTTWSELYEDITLADFRHALDYFLSYGTTDTKQSGGDDDDSQGRRPPTTICDAMICCYGERKLHGSERYASVEVPTHHPTRTVGKDGSISPISRRLGMPLRLWKYPDIEAWIDPPGWNRTMGAESSQGAAFLMMETDPKSSGWGLAPIYWNNSLGNVLVIREDEEDLSVDDLGAICRFVRKKLLPMFEDSADFGTAQRTKKEVLLEFMTAGNLDKLKKERAGCSGKDSNSDYGRF